MHRFAAITGVLLLATWVLPASAQTLVNGGVNTGSISTAGGFDTYTFYGETDQVAWLSVTDVNGRNPNLPGDIYPHIILRDPNNDQLTYDWDSEAVAISQRLTLNGTYTVVVKDRYDNATGPYEVRLARSPGAQEHGGLVNGGTATETLTLGDIDTYTFYGETDQVAWLSVTDVNGRDPNAPGDVYPHVRLYDPNGRFLTYDWDSEAVAISQRLTLNGTYTVVVKDRYDSGTGPYEVRLARTPGAQEHGGLVNGGTATETLTLGDIDSYVFHGSTDDVVSLTVTDVNGSNPNAPGDVYPHIRLYDPNGRFLTYDWDSEAITISQNLTLNGAYTVIVKDRYDNGTGPYTLKFTSSNRGVPAAVVPKALPASGNPRQPAISWAPSAYATWYYVWIQEVGGGAPLRRWYRADQSGCGAGAGSCSGVFPVTLDGTLRMWVAAWNDVAGYADWSDFIQFSTVAGPPPPPAALAPAGAVSSRTPMYEWTRIDNASWYRLWVDDSTGARARQWVTAGQAGCAEVGQTCRFRIDSSVRGASRWWVLSWNADASGQWSGATDFQAPD